MASITMDEWLTELAQCGIDFHHDNADGVSIMDIATAVGKSRESVRLSVVAAIAAGQLEYAGRVARTSITGAVTQVPVYRPVRPKEPRHGRP